MADRVLDEVGKELQQKLAIASDDRGLVGAAGPRELMAGVLGDGFVDVGDIIEHGVEVDVCETCLAGAGFDLGDAQERVERLDHSVEVGKCGFDRGAKLRRCFGTPPGDVEPLAQASDGLFQIVGDIGR